MNYEERLELENTNENKIVELVKREPDDLFELDYYSNAEDEGINYLRQMLKLAKRKIRSKKIDNTGKVRWARAGIEASKILLYSGVVERSERRRTKSDGQWLKEAFGRFHSN
ncbi:MAG: hypothetical protein ACREAK_09200 [Nitrosarchaeum sp.]